MLTCPALQELGPLVRSAERRHHNLIPSSRRERGEPVLPCLARHGHGREDPRVVKQQSHLIRQEAGEKSVLATHTWATHLVVVHVAGGGAPGDGEVGASCVSQGQVPHRRRDWRDKESVPNHGWRI